MGFFEPKYDRQVYWTQQKCWEGIAQKGKVQMDINRILEDIEGCLRRKFNREDATRSQKDAYDEIGDKFRRLGESIEELKSLSRQMEGLAEEARNSELEEYLGDLHRAFNSMEEGVENCRRMAKNIAYDWSTKRPPVSGGRFGI